MSGPIPSISVVVPTLNAGDYLEVALRSAIAQGVSGLELIVVDDGSTDGSTARCKALHPRLRMVRPATPGIAGARNAGIAASSAELIAFLDADDVWLPGKLHAQIALLGRHPEARLCYAGWSEFQSEVADPGDSWRSSVADAARLLNRNPVPAGWIYPELLLDSCVWTSTVVVRRELFDEIGLFDASLPVGEDYDLWLRASRVTPIIAVSQPLALYRKHSASTTSIVRDTCFQALVVERALQRWGLTGPDGRKASAAAVRASLSGIWRRFAAGQALAGNRSLARQALLRSWRLQPWNLHNAALSWQVLMRT